MANFRETYPIDFDLLDKDSQNVLYIEDNSDQLLTLNITNSATKTLQLTDLAAAVNNVNFHFALRFRPGTLSPLSLGNTVNGIKLAASTALRWEMAQPEQDIAGMDVIYLKSRVASFSMTPGTQETIVFENVGADGGQGARGTRVVLDYRNLAFSDAPTLEIQSSREIHMSVINHRGKRDVPLYFGFVGDNGVLNDGVTPNTLQLRITNSLVYDPTNPDYSPLTFGYDADETKKSKIIISFHTGTVEEEFALGSEAVVSTISIQQPTGWTLTEPIAGQSPEWILAPNADIVLPGHDAPPGQANHFDLDLSNIITGYPTGHTHLFVRYENISGYWDGQEELVIEKRPLVFYNEFVGIGKAVPKGYLHVGETLIW